MRAASEQPQVQLRTQSQEGNESDRITVTTSTLWAKYCCTPHMKHARFGERQLSKNLPSMFFSWAEKKQKAQLMWSRWLQRKKKISRYFWVRLDSFKLKAYKSWPQEVRRHWSIPGDCIKFKSCWLDIPASSKLVTSARDTITQHFHTVHSLITMYQSLH